MDRIAEDSRAFAESLLRLSPIAAHRVPSAGSDSHANRPSLPVQTHPGLPSASDQAPNRPAVASTSNAASFQTLADNERVPSPWNCSPDPIESSNRISSSLVDPSMPNVSDHGRRMMTLSNHSSSTEAPLLPGLRSLTGDLNESVDMNQTHRLFAPFLRELLLSSPNVHDLCASADANNRSSLDASDQVSNDQSSISVSEYFYELPQLTMARRLSMLEHECRQSKGLSSFGSIPPILTNSVGDSTSDSDGLDITTGWTGGNESGECSSSDEWFHPRYSKRTQSESGTWTGLEVDSTTAGPQRPTTLSCLIETQQKKHPVSGPPSAGSDSLVSATPTSTSTTKPAELKHLSNPEAVAYQPWKPVDAISKADLFMDLGLDDTDQLLAFGPDFSYHNTIPAVDPDWLDDETPTGCPSTMMESFLLPSAQTDGDRDRAMDDSSDANPNNEISLTRTTDTG